MPDRDLKLGIFDLGLKHKNHDQDVILSSLKSAKIAEKLGYSRYWIGEHFSDKVGWKSTEIMATMLAGTTEKIRVGTAGILLFYRNELLSINNYLMLSDIWR